MQAVGVYLCGIPVLCSLDVLLQVSLQPRLRLIGQGMLREAPLQILGLSDVDVCSCTLQTLNALIVTNGIESGLGGDMAERRRDAMLAPSACRTLTVLFVGSSEPHVSCCVSVTVQAEILPATAVCRRIDLFVLE